MPPAPPQPAIFLDRDNTITVDVDGGYTHRTSDLAFMPGAAIAIRTANTARLPVFIATNQGGIALGRYSESDMHEFHNHLHARLKHEGASITDIAFCPHHPEAKNPQRRHCPCRKPLPGMLLDLAARHGIDLTASVMIGDRDTDMAAAEAAGAKGILYTGGDLLPFMQRAIHLCKQAKAG